MVDLFKRKNSLFLFVFVMLSFLQSCRKNNEAVVDMQQDVYFSSSITGLPQTKAVGMQWEVDDRISVYMYKSGSGLNENSLVEGGANVAYKTNGNGNFSPLDPANKLQYPMGINVDFTAFYPFQDVHAFKPVLDIVSQEKQSAIDYMYAQVSDISGLVNGPVRLPFQRLMSKIELRVLTEKAGDMTAVFTDVNTLAEFDLNTLTLNDMGAKQSVKGKVSDVVGNEKKVEWILFPGTLTDAHKIVFTDSEGEKYTWDIGKDGLELIKGHRYQYTITLGKEGVVEPKPSASYFELPIITETSTLKYSMKSVASTGRRNFSMLYDGEQGIAHWVAYPLVPAHFASGGRSDAWAYDRDYPNNWQANLSSSYRQASLDRGHQIPSGDRTAHRAENVQTFLYSNMTPQEQNLNQKIWADLENKVRAWSKASGVDTLYVVTGAMATKKGDNTITYAQDKSGKNIAKPKYYYKALAMKRKDKYYTIGFLMDNVNTGDDRNYMNRKVTVAELEEETGYTFFPALNKTEKSVIDSKVWQ